MSLPRRLSKKIFEVYERLSPWQQKNLIRDYDWLQNLERGVVNLYQTNPTGYQALLSELTDFLANIYKKEKINERLQGWLRHSLPYQPAVEPEMVFTGNESQEFCQQFCQEHGFEEILKSLKKCPDVTLFKRLETVFRPILYERSGGNLNSARVARVKTALLNLAQFPYPEAAEYLFSLKKQEVDINEVS